MRRVWTIFKTTVSSSIVLIISAMKPTAMTYCSSWIWWC